MTFMFVCLFVSIVAAVVSYIDFKIGNNMMAWFAAFISILNFAAFLNLAYHI